MINYYLDSSAWVKVYVTETGTAWVMTLFNAGVSSDRPLYQLSSASIALVEVAAAIARHERTGKIKRANQRELYRRLIYDSENRTNQLGLSDDILHLAAELTQRRPLRGFDAIHLATALTLTQSITNAGLPSLVFVSADANLCACAIAEGLAADNPNDHS
jgi:predicted nucleic acid-binding protein